MILYLIKRIRGHIDITLLVFASVSRFCRYESKTSSHSTKMANLHITHQSRTKLNDKESNGIA